VGTSNSAESIWRSRTIIRIRGGGGGVGTLGRFRTSDNAESIRRRWSIVWIWYSRDGACVFHGFCASSSPESIWSSPKSIWRRKRAVIRFWLRLSRD
jgi:hypothetical protein